MLDSKKETGADKGAAPAPKKERTGLLKEISAMDGQQLLDYAVKKVLIPYGKKAILEILSTYFNTKTSPTPTGSSIGSTDTYYADKTASTVQSYQSTSLSAATRSVYDYEKIEYERYEEAERILNSLLETLARYGRVRVSELYELSGAQPVPNDFAWGWKSLEGAAVVTVSGVKGMAYKISVPRPTILK